MEIIEEKIIITVEEKPVIIRTGEPEGGFPVWGEITGELEHQRDLQAALDGKSDTGHTHDDRYYTEAETDTLLSGKSDTGHTHDDRYYTEAETDTLLSGKSDTGHTHDSRYYTKTEIDAALADKADVITDTASGDPAAFPDGGNGVPVISLTAAIEAAQSGSGDPAPDNVRPISGWTGCTVSRSDGVLAPETVTVSWQSAAGTVYGGTLDVTTGLLTVTMAYMYVTSCYDIIPGSDSAHSTTPSQLIRVLITPTGAGKVTQTSEVGNIRASYLKTVKFTDARDIEDNLIASNKAGTAMLLKIVTGDIIDTKTEADDYLSAHPLQIVYELATPVTYQLTGNQMNTLLGDNTVSADTGGVTVTYRADTKRYVDKKIAAVEALALDQ